VGLFFQSQDWIRRNSFFSKPGCRDYFFRARTGSAEIPSSRSRSAEIIFSEPGLDREKFLLLEAGLQRLFFQSQDWIGRNSFFSTVHSSVTENEGCG
jgi:hypothetical protein